MRHLMAWVTIATGACLVAGCKGKSAQDALEGVGPVPKDSSMMAPSDNADNTPATFHPNHEKQAPVAAPGTFSDNGRYVVQVRVFETRVHADAMVAKLSALGFPAYIAVVEDPTTDLPGTYYRVRISGFDSREAATAFGEASLKPQGYDFWVDTKANDHVGAGSGASKSNTSMAAAAPATAPVPTPTPTPSPRESHRRHGHVSASGSMATPPFGTVRPDNTPRFSGHVGLDVGAPPPPPSPVSPPAASAHANVQATVPPPPPPMQPVSQPQPMVNPSESSAAAPNATAAPAAAPAVKMSFGAQAPDGSEPTPAIAPTPAPAPQLDTNSPPASSPSTQKDTMQSPFAREGYYRPVDSSTPPPATSVPDADTAPDSRRTLPTW